jgi:hypothetical protein
MNRVVKHPTCEACGEELMDTEIESAIENGLDFDSVACDDCFFKWLSNRQQGE